MLQPWPLTWQRTSFSSRMADAELAGDWNRTPDPLAVRALLCTTAPSIWSSWKPAAAPTTGHDDSGARHRGALAAGALRPSLCQTQQDRCRRCGGVARGRSLRRHHPGADQVRRATGAAVPAPHPLAVDGHPHRADQCAARLLPRVRDRYRAGPASGWSRSRACSPTRTQRCPTLLRATMRSMIEEIRLLEARISDLETAARRARRQSAACATLLSVPGVGLLTATAMVAATGGEVSHFKAPATSPPGSASPRRNTPPARPAASAASPSAAIDTCACCSPTARARCSRRHLATRMQPPHRSTTALGACRSSRAAITTRPSARSPISSRASAMRCCVIRNPMAALG